MLSTGWGGRLVRHEGPRTGGNVFALLAIVTTAIALGACAQNPGVANKTAYRSARLVSPMVARTTRLVPSGTGPSYGIASFYTEGTKTASGEKFDPNELTAAHPSLPFGTRLRVTNVATGRSVTVRVNDRGPFVAGRAVDVSYSAAEQLGIVGQGVARVKLDVVR
jgi:rare lipoprotein A